MLLVETNTSRFHRTLRQQNHVCLWIMDRTLVAKNTCSSLAQNCEHLECLPYGSVEKCLGASVNDLVECYLDDQMHGIDTAMGIMQ